MRFCWSSGKTYDRNGIGITVSLKVLAGCAIFIPRKNDHG